MSTSETGSAEPDLVILLALAFRSAIDLLSRRLKEEGYGVGHLSFGYTFRAIQDGSLTLTELAARLAITKQGAQKIVDEMESAGLVDRGPSQVDGRQKLVSLTARGRQAWQLALTMSHDAEATLARECGEEAVAQMKSTLLHFVQAQGSGAEARAHRARPVW
jgi:DNA-binding MarR family transcriptional regulator